MILRWQKFDAIGQVCIVADGQMFLNDLAIWSHWLICGTINELKFALKSWSVSGCLKAS